MMNSTRRGMFFRFPRIHLISILFYTWFRSLIGVWTSLAAMERESCVTVRASRENSRKKTGCIKEVLATSRMCDF
jgi:hypothetical protein